MNIYEIAKEYNNHVLDYIENDDDQALYALFKMKDVFENKAENYAKIITNFTAESEALENEIQRLKKKQKTIKTAIAKLKENLFEAMKQTGKTKFKKGIFSFSIQKNGGKQKVVVDCDLEDLPDDFIRIKKEADSEKIRQYIEETGDISYFHLADRGERLVIR